MSILNFEKRDTAQKVSAAASSRLVDLTRDGTIMAFWNLGMDTAEIASRFGVRESLIANRLAAIRDRS